MQKPKIIIAGGGFGGVRVALDLVKYLPQSEITLINDTKYHCYNADLYEVATATLDSETERAFKNLGSTVLISLKDIFKNKSLEVLIEKIKQIDLENKEVKTDSKTLNYDFLVIALGSTTSYFDIEGAKDFSHSFKSAQDALNIRNDLRELEESGKNPVSVVIAGGGFAGVELAGELYQYIKKNYQITLVEGSETLLPGMPKWSQEEALKRLKQLKVEVLLKHLIKKVEKDRLICEDGSIINFDYLIWTAGVRGRLTQDLITGIALTKKGQIPVQADLSIEKFPEVFVVGDVAGYIDPELKKPALQTAWTAMAQAKIASKNLLNTLTSQSRLNYKFYDPGFIVSIGSKYALSNNFGLKIKGFLGWVAKRMIVLVYLLSILPFEKAFRIWFRGVKIYSEND